MARIGVYVERYNISRSEEMEALTRFSYVARRLGHQADYLFRADTPKIPQYDAIYIRALTDPLNSAYVAARTAELNGIRVIDQPESIYICCDKVNMYRHLQNAGVPIPETIYLQESDLTLEKGSELLENLGSPVVLKAPNSSFSMYVERIHTPEDFVRVGNRYMRRADRLVAQKFVVSDFDWRVSVLGGEPLFVCQYTIPKKRWKVLTYVENGKAVYGPVRGIEIDKVHPMLLETALKAGAAIGKGLYGVDIKQVGDQFVVIEVNDNPTISAGEEDQKAPLVYERIVRYLVGEWGGKLTAGIKLRKATIDDLDALVELEKKGFTVDLFERDQFKYLLTRANATVLVIEASSIIAGAAIMLWRKNLKSGRLYNIVINPSLHGRGIGSKLIEACQKEAIGHGCSSITLEVRTDNHRAISFYQRHGFIRVKTVPGYYSDGGSALKMKKTL